MTGLDGQLDLTIINQLIVAKERLHELTVRKPLSPAETLGHFCTELRRLSVISALAHINLWKAPFKPDTYGWPKTVYYGTENFIISYARVSHLCEVVESMTEEDIELTRALNTLQGQLPAIVNKTVEVERLTRQATTLVTEANTFAATQERTA